jgi:N6-adenosine-specific RNA methylase IME4
MSRGIRIADIARMFPDVPKLELFARAPRPGWDVGGAEVMTSDCR